MSGVATPQPSPNEYWSNSNEAYSIPPKTSTKNQSLYPIDETEDFQDPFSDLSLFLAKKVKEEVTKRGGVKKWNHQIQTDLLKSILPDFKNKFPRYRLGIAALRKTWEKITYYQQKISSAKQAYQHNGKLNLEFLIKENIRNCQQNASSSGFHPYNHSQNLAVHLSECVATLEGSCPKLSSLTKTIWAVQKHLYGESIPKASTPFEEYDPIDKLIVKTMLRNIVKSPLLSREELADNIQKTITSLLQLPFLSSLEELSSFLSMMIARKMAKTSKILKDLTGEKIQNLKEFLINHIRRSTPSKHSSQKPNRLTLVQKILALYPLGELLPKNIDKDKLKSAVRLINQEKSHSFLSDYPNFDPTLYAFIKTEILLLKDKKGAYTTEKIENAIAEAYDEMSQVPYIDEKTIDQLETYLWMLIDEIDQQTGTFLDQGFTEILEEIENAIIDMPHLTFRGLVQSLTQTFKQIRKMERNPDYLKEKVFYWTLQNDMVCRYLHVDKQNLLYSLITEHYQSGKHLTHKEIVMTICEEYLKQYPFLGSCKEQLTHRIYILYKHCWYHDQGKGKSPFDAFLNWHTHDLEHLSKIEMKEELNRRVQALLPLTPFSQDVEA